MNRFAADAFQTFDGAGSGVPRGFGGLGRGVLEGLLEALSPTRCAGCEKLGPLICESCLDGLFLIDPVQCCSRCGAPFGAALCTECRGREAVVSRCLAVATFDGPLPRIIRSYKDAGERRLARPIAEMLYDAADHAERVAPYRYGGILSGCDALSFVPATATAYRRRGFDHMEGIARELSTLSGVPVVDVMVKHGSGDQRLLGREGRLASSRGLYGVRGDIRGARLLLLDDVVTTGATISAASQALLDAGARGVDALALARVL